MRNRRFKLTGPKRDGTHQADRQDPALDPGFAPLDGRSWRDLLEFTSQYASGLAFVRLDGNENRNWANFLPDQDSEEWEQLVRSLEHPQNASPNVLPHRDLFIAFLRLLRYPREQLNDLVGKHLDFVYRETLGLGARAAVPDRLHAVFSLVPDADPVVLPAGVLLDAEVDSADQPLTYALDRPLAVTTAKVTALKSVYVDQRSLDIRTAHAAYRESSDHGFMKMMTVALGNPLPGDPLPPYDGNPITLDTDLKKVFDDLQGAGKKQASDYVWGQLYLGATAAEASNNFEFLVGAQKADRKDRSSVPRQQWGVVYDMLEAAYARKDFAKRARHWKATREEALPRGETDAQAKRAAFMMMMNRALGDPPAEGADPVLPPTPGGVDLFALQTTLADAGADDGLRADARAYVNDTLYLSEEEFEFIINTETKEEESAAPKEDWNQVYALVEQAHQRKLTDRGLAEALDPPVIHEWHNLFAAADASAVAAQSANAGGNEAWKTFGRALLLPDPNDLTSQLPDEGIMPGRLGLGVSSPMLALAEGERTVVLTFDFSAESYAPRAAEIAKLLTAGVADVSLQPFRASLTDGAASIDFAEFELRAGAFLVRYDGETYELDFGAPANNRFTVTRKQGSAFDKSDEEVGYLVDASGALFRILEFQDADTVIAVAALNDPTEAITKIEDVAKLSPLPLGRKFQVQKLTADDLCFHGLQFILSADAFAAAMGANEQGEAPMLEVALNDLTLSPSDTEYSRSQIKRYSLFRELDLSRVHLRVAAGKLTGFRIQNDDTPLEPNKPFLPFGAEPANGSRFYFSHPEIAAKPLETLEASFEWKGAPTSLVDQYQAYDQILQEPPTTGKPTSQTVSKNSQFKAKLRLNQGGSEFAFDDWSLFNNSDASTQQDVGSDGIEACLAQRAPGFHYGYLSDAGPGDDFADWRRFWILELKPPDFGHSRYPAVVSKQAQFQVTEATTAEQNIKTLTVLPPYTPELKTLRIGYSAHADTAIAQYDPGSAPTRLYHLHPFGKTLPEPARDGKDTGTLRFLPDYSHSGELYLGIEDVEPAANLTLLFQLARGSANPNIPPAEVEWSYRDGDQWKPFSPLDIPADGTHGLVDSGVIEFKLPSVAEPADELLPPGPFWIRAAVERSAAAVSDTIAILPHAVSATLAAEDVTAEHFENPLPPNSISGLVEPVGEIDEIAQPFSSFAGAPAESATEFYIRVSERLRHKGRALSIWDYERLTLERFPSIHNAKCLPAGIIPGREGSGNIVMILVPDVHGETPFDPFEPKVSAATLRAVQASLAALVPVGASVTTRNPVYNQVRVRLAIRLQRGVDEETAIAGINESIKQFLAPWAFNPAVSISFGGRVYANLIADHVERNPFVEFCVINELFRVDPSGNIQSAQALSPEARSVYVEPDRVDAILTTAPEHEITLIGDEGFDPAAYTGIGYMAIEEDFFVAADPNPT